MEEKDLGDIVMCGGHECKVDVCPRTENLNVCQAASIELAVWYTQEQ